MSLVRFASPLVFVALALPLSGCVVTMNRYNEAVAEAERARAAQTELEQRVAQLKNEIAKLGEEIRLRDQKLAEAALDQSNTHQKLDDMSAVNVELSRRLEKAGQSVQALANERGNLSAALAETKKKLDELAKLEREAEQRTAEMRALAKSFQGMVDAGQLKVVVRGGRIVLELPNDVLFDSGKTDLKEQGKAALLQIAKVLAPMKGRHFEVAGHTDDVKIQSARFPSNWELSTARAVTVTKLLVDKGSVNPREFSAAGYGEFAPVADNGTPEGRAKNRRIEIILIPIIDEKMLGR